MKPLNITAINFMVFSKRLITIGLLCLAVEAVGDKLRRREDQVHKLAKKETGIHENDIHERIMEEYNDGKEQERERIKKDYKRVMKELKTRGKWNNYEVSPNTPTYGIGSPSSSVARKPVRGAKAKTPTT